METQTFEQKCDELKECETIQHNTLLRQLEIENKLAELRANFLRDAQRLQELWAVENDEWRRAKLTCERLARELDAMVAA